MPNSNHDTPNKYPLDPKNGGRNCPYNGRHFYDDGQPIECGCDECEYYMLCFAFMKFDENGGYNSIEALKEAQTECREDLLPDFMN